MSLQDHVPLLPQASTPIEYDASKSSRLHRLLAAYTKYGRLASASSLEESSDIFGVMITEWNMAFMLLMTLATNGPKDYPNENKDDPVTELFSSLGVATCLSGLFFAALCGIIMWSEFSTIQTGVVIAFKRREAQFLLIFSVVMRFTTLLALASSLFMLLFHGRMTYLTAEPAQCPLPLALGRVAYIALLIFSPAGFIGLLCLAIDKWEQRQS